MDLFNPKTFSTDWELQVIDKLERCVRTDKLLGFAGALREELDLDIQVDWNAIEFAMGINTSFGQFWERILRITDRASQVVRELDLDLFAAGAHPTERMYNSSHVHVGTAHDETNAIYLENQIMRYVPAFGALAANSPVAHGLRGEFKSYRVRDCAYVFTTPSEVRDPWTAQPSDWTDASPKLYGAPTVEVRITDCASSRRLLAEFVTFIAAYVHYRGKMVEEYRCPPEEYREFLTNRWTAARDGMQATFLWNGKPRLVADLLDEMLDECADELENLGAKRADFALLNAMIRKRVCQADFVLGFAGRYPDVWCLTSAYAKLIRQWDAFDQYLESAPALDPIPAPDEQAVLAEHLAFVGEGTHFYRLHDAMRYPWPVTGEIIERLVRQGLVKREVTPRRGTLLYRL